MSKKIYRFLYKVWLPTRDTIHKVTNSVTSWLNDKCEFTLDELLIQWEDNDDYAPDYDGIDLELSDNDFKKFCGSLKEDK